MPFDPARDKPVAPSLSYYNVLVVNNNEPTKACASWVATASQSGKAGLRLGRCGRLQPSGALLFAKRSDIRDEPHPHKGNARR